MSTRLHDWNLDDAVEREAMLTAHVLGELDAEAAAAVEARLAADPGLRAELEAIRAVAGELEAAFAADPAAGTGLDAGRRAAVDAGGGHAAAAGGAAGSPAAVEIRDAGGAGARASASLLLRIRRRLPAVGAGLAAAAVLGFTAIVVLDGGWRGGDETDVAIGDGRRAVQPETAADAPLPQQPALPPAPGADVGGGSGAARSDSAVAGGAAAEPEAAQRRAEPEKSPPMLRDEAFAAAGAPEPAAAAAAPAPAPPPAASPPPPNVRRPRVAAPEPEPDWIPSSLPELRRDRPDAIPEPSRERSEALVDNPWTSAAEQPLSTFSIDVDTASYALVRRHLEHGSHPPRDAVRIEELINAFEYDYPVPAAGDDHPFSVSVDAGPAPWAEEHRLVRVGLEGFELSMAERPAANLVFLIDVSGSMRAQAKLPLVKAGLRLLLRELGPSDRVAIVTYAGDAGLVLDSTAVTDSGRAAIEAAIDGLSAAGSTNGAGGLDLAYRVAAAHRIGGGMNRVILCTDGDFNVGASGPDALQALIEDRRDAGIFLNVMGFGTGDYQDGAMERLSNHGNGIAAYVDSIREAEKVFVRGAVGSLVTIARDVKVQIDFNPGRVRGYRLIGYANRMLAAEDFADDRVDAGELGAGHAVTALYEIVPAGVAMPRQVEGSKYVRPAEADGRPAGPDLVDSPELLTVRVRYRQPEGGESVRFDTPFVDAGAELEATSTDFRFAAAVAGFGMLLRDSAYAGTLDWDLVERLATPGLADDPHGDRREFLGLVRAAAVAGD